MHDIYGTSPMYLYILGHLPGVACGSAARRNEGEKRCRRQRSSKNARQRDFNGRVAHGIVPVEYEPAPQRYSHGRPGQGRAGQARPGQGGQDRTGQGRAGQDRTGQDRTGQDRIGQDTIGYDRIGTTGQDRTGQDKIGTG